MSGMKRAMRQFTFGSGKTAGRNSSGRITSFHRGGGAKRSQRTIDLKRNTSSSIGVVERIEYDPNRSSRIALVRWLNGIRTPIPRSTTTTANSTTAASPRVLQFDPSSSSTVESSDNNNDNDGVRDSVRGVFGFHSMIPDTRKNSGDVFLSAFMSKAKEGKFDSVSMPLGLPRIAVAATRPNFFATRVKGEETVQVRNWKKNSDVWVHKNKRKAAISWHHNA